MGVSGKRCDPFGNRRGSERRENALCDGHLDGGRSRWDASWVRRQLANACSGEVGCLGAFVIGVIGAPFCAAVGALAGGLTAFRAAQKSESTGSAIWKRSFGFGFLSLLPSTFLAYAVVPSIL